MHILSIKYNRAVNENELWHGFHQLLGYLRHNGQSIGRETQPYKHKNRMYATIFTAEETALHKKYYNQYVKDQIKWLEKLCGSKIEISYAGAAEDEEHSICKCKKYEHFLLYYFNRFSPLICGTCNKAVPLYKIPKLHDFGFYPVTSWQSNFMACVMLDVNSAVGEKWAIQQQCNCNSGLSQQGRKVAKDISKATGVKTYYYLCNFSKRSKVKDMARPCPGCGGSWRLLEKIHDFIWFRCDRCLLMSTNATR
jgi:predicted  nucleic acid-binding Zn ribbon protein